jgi:hypothetical protein
MQTTTYRYRVTVKPGAIVKIEGIPLIADHPIVLHTGTDIRGFGASEEDYKVEEANFELESTGENNE